MTKHEAALLLERMVDEGKDLTSEAAEALMMGVNALNGYNVDEWCLHCKEYDQKAHNCPRFNRIIHHAAVAVRSSQWLSCNERLPDKMGQYLVTVGSSYRPIRVYDFDPLDMAEDKNKKYWRNDCDDHSHVFDYFVKAWMPLPDPYQPEPEEHTGCTSDACPIEGVLQDE